MSQGSPPTGDGARTQRQREEDLRKAAGPKPRVRKWRILLITSGLIVLAGISTVFGMMMAVASELPQLEDRQQYKISKASIMYDDNGKVITRLRNNQNRILVTSTQISPTMKQAVVAVEDRRFYEHGGVDARGIARAVVADVMGGGAKQGASTITQQFVKNALAAQDQRTVMQKLRESALAFHLENQWTKDKVLTEYLNAIYFGNGAYGIESAAETYFAKAHPGCQPKCAQKLLPWEAALLAGVIASPSGYDPLVYPARATERRDLVLTNMYNQGYITKEILEQGKITAVPTADEITRSKEDSAAPYFSTFVRQQLVDRYGAGTAFGGGLRVYTTLNLEMQQAAKRSIEATLPVGGPSASMVAIENKTGKIRALYGGDNYDERPFNLATQGQRQPGSSFKPFTLIAALRKYSLGSTWKSAPIGKAGSGTRIINYDDNYLGSTTLLNATTTSDNTAYVRVGLQVGVNKIARQAKAMGISTQISRNTAMILGGLSEGVTPLEMAYSYAAIANQGRKPIGTLAPDENSPVAVDKVLQNGKIFRKQRDRTTYKRVFSQRVGRDARTALRSVVISGTGKKANPGFWVAGKTGTTENYGDAWFVGFSEKLSVAIWVGYPDKTVPMLTQFGGEPVAGGTFPAMIFQNFIRQAHAILKNKRSGKRGSTDPVTGAVGPSDTGSYAGGGSTTTTEQNGEGKTSTPEPNNTDNVTPRENTPRQPATQPQPPATVPEQNTGGNAGGDGGAAAPGQ